MANEPRTAIANPMGFGIYTILEAARLLQVSSQKLTRWAEGYIFPIKGDTHASAPILDRDEAETGILNFHDLVELFFVREFRKANVPLPAIRRDAAILRDKWETPYPFSFRRIVEFNRHLVDAEEMHTIWGEQQVFEFGKAFFNDMDFDATGLASAWHPLGMGKLILLDPARSFGAPIEVRSGIRTEVLVRQYRAEGEYQAVADWYEVALEPVEQAVEFEEKWRIKAA